MMVEFELVNGGGMIAVNSSHVVYVRPAKVAGHVDVMLTPDTEESNYFTILGNYPDVVSKIQEAQAYGQG